MKHSFSVFLMLILVACQTKKNKITFYIENGSRVDTIVNINVWIEGRKVVDTNFVYSTITPNYDTFIIEEPMKDSVLISVSTNTGANRQFKIKFDKNAYVFLAYVHDSITTEKQRKVIEQMKKELNGYDPSVLLEKKAIREKVQYTEPLLY
ncbi:hypothetical protein P1X15_01940 [Runella sp. MFBS21]|uniref:hypothetical protein n=1 Tax=Runella sp. MFBS21 TaxID=3034018 RepID=UPI0023F790BF|nr:hypothetical protein [Runella sp. MFBS21]MDF7816328.1 hypothetical protein [Runella sp. MFBS21]